MLNRDVPLHQASRTSLTCAVPWLGHGIQKPLPKDKLGEGQAAPSPAQVKAFMSLNPVVIFGETVISPADEATSVREILFSQWDLG